MSLRLPCYLLMLVAILMAGGHLPVKAEQTAVERQEVSQALAVPMGAAAGPGTALRQSVATFTLREIAISLTLIVLAALFLLLIITPPSRDRRLR